MLQALELPLPKRILSHAHWTVNRQKMSKSIGNVADPFKAMDELGVDLVRYYLARIGGRFKDDVGKHLSFDRLASAPWGSLTSFLSTISRLVSRTTGETRIRATVFAGELLPAHYLQGD